MRVKALTSFAGAVSLGVGQEANIDDKVVLADLVQAGFVEVIEEEEKKTTKKEVSKNESKRNNN